MSTKSSSLWSRIGRRRSSKDHVEPPPPYSPYPAAPVSPLSPIPAVAPLTPSTPSAAFPASPMSSRLTPLPQSGSRSRSPSPHQASTDADPYAFLSTFDTAFIIDDSGSMAGRRWREVDSCLSQIAPVCTSHDDDGIDIYFLNHRSDRTPSRGKGPAGYQGVSTASEVQNLFRTIRPGGRTLTGTRLKAVLDPYLTLLEANADHLDDVKPLNVIVLTDGEAQDDPESVIIHAARKLDRIDAPPYQLGIQFFQVGNDPDAREALRDLDDAISDRASVRDIVDTVTWPEGQDSPQLTPDLVLKTVLGAVVRRLDRRT